MDESHRILGAGLLDTLERIALQAGARIMQIYATGVTASLKGDGSPLTEADLAAEAIILAGLAAAAPDIPVVSEEDGGGIGPRPDPEAVFLLVDPLDGTREFLDRNGEFTVNIAMVAAGVPIAGVVLAPATGRLWSGVSGMGASVQAVGSDGVAGARRPITVRARPDGDLIAVTSRSHLTAETEAFLASLPIGERRSIGSSLKFCLVAQGDADVYPRFGPTMEWDTAAGQAVLAAAGGRVTDPTGMPLVYGKRATGYRNGSFIAWGG